MRILFATDGSTEAESAKEYLGSLPLAAGSELLIVSAVSPRETAETAGEKGAQSPTLPASPEIAKETVDQAAYYLAKPGLSTECLVTGGDPADVVCWTAEERKIELVVVGSRGRSRMARLLLGSVSHRVAKHAGCPVLVVKPFIGPIQTVLVGVDGLEDSQKVVSYLKRFPLPPDSTVVAVHVVHLPLPTFSGTRGYYETAELSGEVEKLRLAAETKGKEILDETVKTMCKSNKVESKLTTGPPARRLVSIVRELNAKMVVVGSWGLTGAERFLKGSVSLQVCEQAPCSVLVVR